MQRQTIRDRFKSEGFETPLSSMIDIVFLLLIYFIVVNKPLSEETILGVSLPDGRENLRLPSRSLFMVNVDRLFKTNPEKDLKYYTIKGQPWTLENISKLFRNSDSFKKDTTVLINCGPNARHEKLIRLLDVCQHAGLKNLNLINDNSVPFDP